MCLQYFTILMNPTSMYGQKIKVLLKKKGITQKDLSKALEIPESSASVWLNAEYPPLEFIMKCCEYFNIEIWRFFAPKDLVVPDASETMKKLVIMFESLPEGLQNSCLQVIERFQEAYTAGKGGKFGKAS